MQNKVVEELEKQKFVNKTAMKESQKLTSNLVFINSNNSGFRSVFSKFSKFRNLNV